MELIDSHCHLYDTRGVPIDDVIAAARAAGVTTMVNVGCDAATTAAAIDIASRYDGVHATVGLHPHDATDGIESVTGFLDDRHVIAVGEAGLDYFYEHSPRDVQRRVFADQIQIAHERSLPLVIHTRDAWTDTFDVLDAEGTPERTIFHCFTGGPDEARRCVDLGAFVSFSGIVTFKTSVDLQAAATMCPLDRVLVETDSPYLAPVPFRGKTNQPAHVRHTAQCVADLRGMTLEALATATVANTLRAFPLLAAHRG
ncbi:MAG: TatD family hydrolase [Actinobacteria bacterium]|nr:TatD family hydrolase [Actinomycetota bacterium]